MTTIEQPGADLYDVIPYPNLSHSKTHPDRLATLARLLGMDPAPVDRCRVLEIGCASGANLLPMAYGLPGSHFVGLDYSRRQIEVAREAVAAVGLDNLSLITADILDLPADLGQFDYIIAHGIYSWVPLPVREALLAGCRRLLAPQGVAYVSLNVYPGWYLLQTIRDLMAYSGRKAEDPLEKAQLGRQGVHFVAESLAGDDHPFSLFLARYVATILDEIKADGPRGNAYLLHDELSEVNDPVYFHEFNRHISQHGLQYMAEAEFAEVMPGRLGQEVADRLRQMVTSLEEVEQYLDFLHHRTFRQTLLCHQEIDLQRVLKPATVFDYRLSTRVTTTTTAEALASDQPAEFTGADKATFTTDHPLSKAAFFHLSRIAPQAVDFPSLVQAAAALLSIPSGTDVSAEAITLATKVLKAYSYSSSLVNLHTYTPPFVTEVSERPVASPVARFQAQESATVTSMRHERISLDGVTLHLIGMLDGQNDREALLAWLGEQYAQGHLALPTDADSDAERTATMAAGLDKALASLANAALLVA